MMLDHPGKIHLKASQRRPAAFACLLIEDNPGDAQLIKLMLAEADGESFELRHVERLEAGLRELGNGKIDIVLSDLSLPDSYGLDSFLRYTLAPRMCRSSF